MTTEVRPPLTPVMGVSPLPNWPGAVWIGEIDVADIEAAPGRDRIALSGSDGYATARLLLRCGIEPIGFAEVPIADGGVAAGLLAAQIPAALSPAVPSGPASDENLPTITVSVSTRDRLPDLKGALPSLLALDYPHYDVLIVDNAPSDGATEDYIRELDHPRIRLVTEPRPGLSYGRNRALVESQAQIVAYTDDDVVVDPNWLRALARGFARSDEVGLVTGMVPTGELRTPAQSYFESRTSWLRACAPELYSLNTPRPDIAAFPLDVGRYGTGANFAIRRDVGLGLGGFNEALGIGSPARGGEDVDMFVRVIFAGDSLAYEPAAIVWHRHRDDLAALRNQMRNYGISWTAWFASLVDNRQTRRTALVLAGKHLRRRLAERSRPASTAPTPPAGGPNDINDINGIDGIADMRRTELLALLRGPFAYAHARLSGRRTRPLAR